MDKAAQILKESVEWLKLVRNFMVKFDVWKRPSLQSFVDGIFLKFGSLQVLFATIYSCPIPFKFRILINEEWTLACAVELFWYLQNFQNYKMLKMASFQENCNHQTDQNWLCSNIKLYHEKIR